MKPKIIMAEAGFRRDRIRERAVDSINKAFPFEGKRFSVSVEDVKVHPADFSPEKHKQAILQAKTLAESVRGTLILKNKEGEVIQRVPKFNLLQLPYMTDHGTFVIGGTTYSVSNQLRMKPGVYTRKRKNDELEAGFNLSKGDNFRLSMDPANGHFNMEYGTTKIPLYPVLKSLGVSDDNMSKHWNKELVGVNKAAFEKHTDKHVDKLYKRLVNPYARETGEDKVQAIRTALDNTAMDPEINRRTLGQPLAKADSTALLTASGKLLKAYSDEADFDERDSLAFKKLLTVDDFIGERIGLDSRDVQRKVLGRLESGTPDLERAVPRSPFTKSIQGFLSTSQLSNPPDQINPMEMIDSSVRVTSMGEGGIENMRAIPQEARRIHSSHATFFDPVRTPENERVGIDLRASIFSAKDEAGDMYVPLYNVKQKKEQFIPVTEAVDKTIAFPKQKLSGNVDVIQNNQIRSVNAREVDYQIPSSHYLMSSSSNLIPFIDSMDGNRGTIGSKMQTQALPLEDADAPYVQVESYRPNVSMESLFGKFVVPHSPISGRVVSVKDGRIRIAPHRRGTKTSAEDVSVNYYKNFPLASKTYLNNKLLVKPGDEVKEGQRLADDAFVKDGTLALGKNLLTAYMPWRGLNSNDAVVVSESAAKKMTSRHMYKEGLDLDQETRVSKKLHQTYFGGAHDKLSYDGLDENGVAKQGQIVNKGDLLISSLRKTQLTPESAMLGKLHKSLVRPYKDDAVVWTHDRPGRVTDVVHAGNKIRLTVKTKEPLVIGDKLSPRFGNKGVVAKIVPDDQMIKDEQGRTVDLILTPAGVVSRINPAQILETAMGKVAEKTGKPVLIENYADRDNTQWVKDQLKKHGIKDKETVLDPNTGKKIPGVFVGNTYVMKLFKSTDTNYSARNVEDYDANQQPSGGGKRGAKSLGTMEINALLAHGAPNILREASTLKSQRNDAYWRAYQLGLPTPEPSTTFSYDKFGSMLTGSGIKVSKNGNKIRLTPLTDDETKKMAPHVVTNSLLVRAKDLQPERGGLFDPVITGGTAGEKWSRIDLTEPVLNPVFEKPVKSLLGISSTELGDQIRTQGGKDLKKQLNLIDPESRRKEVLGEIKTARGAERDRKIKELKYLDGLNKSGLRAGDAYTMSTIPVVPPVFRPIIPGRRGDLQISDANYLYRDLMIADDMFKKSKTLPEKEQGDARKHVYDATKALFGLGDPVSPQSKGRSVKGFIANLAGVGSSPKYGFFQSKLLKKRQDVSGRGTIVPDANMGLDEVGIPEEMGWDMYKPFIARKMIQRGYGAMDARKRIDDRDPVAREFLVQETKERPVLLNRAPSLRRYNVLAAYPKLVPGKSLRIHELLAPIQAGDFDGDTMQVHVPVGEKAVEESKNLMLSNMLLGDQYKMQTTVTPQHEAVDALYRASAAKPVGKKQIFKTKGDAMAAYHRGEITLGTPVEIKK